MFGRHYGITKASQRRVAVVMPYLPNATDPDPQCLIVDLDSLPHQWSDVLVPIINSAANTPNLDAHFADAILKFTGKNALQSLHENGYLKKYPVASIILTPSHNSGNVPLIEVVKLFPNFRHDTQPLAQHAPPPVDTQPLPVQHALPPVDVQPQQRTNHIDLDNMAPDEAMQHLEQLMEDVKQRAQPEQNTQPPVEPQPLMPSLDQVTAVMAQPFDPPQAVATEYSKVVPDTYSVLLEKFASSLADEMRKSDSPATLLKDAINTISTIGNAVTKTRRPNK